MLGATVLDAFEAPKKSKKHKKDKKKVKKAKKAKQPSRIDAQADLGASAGSSSSGEELDNAAQPAEPTAAPLAREEWMTTASARSILQPAVAAPAKPEFKEPEIHVGLRIMKAAEGTAAAADASPATVRPPAAAAPPRPGVVGDGGVSWRLKALRRSQETAKEAGQDVASVVAERFGSLAALTQGISERRAADERAHLHAAHQRRGLGGNASQPWRRQPGTEADEDGGGRDNKTGERDTKASERDTNAGERDRPGAPRAGEPGTARTAVPHYLASARSEAGQMKRPTASGRDDGGLSWRRPGAKAGEGERGGGRAGQTTVLTQRRDDNQVPSANAGHNAPSERRGDGADAVGGTAAAHDSRRDSADRRRDDDRRERRDDVGDKEGTREKRDKGGSHARTGPADRGGHGERHDRDRDGCRERAPDNRRDSGRDNKQDSNRRDDGRDSGLRGNGDGRHGERRGDGPGREERRDVPPVMSHQQQAALLGVASSLNAHADDGGFMSRFKALERVNAAAKEAAAAAAAASPLPSVTTTTSTKAADDSAARDGATGEVARVADAGDRRASVSDTDDAAVAGMTTAPAGAPAAAATAAPSVGGRADSNRAIADALRREVRPAASGGGIGDNGNASSAHALPTAAPPGASGSDDAANKSVAAMLKARLRAGRTVSNKDDLPATPAIPAVPPPAPRRPQSHPADSAGGGDMAPSPAVQSKRDVEQLPSVDSRGRAAPGAFGRESAGQAVAEDAAAGGRKKAGKRVERYDADGKKTRYFADDDDVDLETLVKRTKYGDDGDADMDRTVTDNVMRRGANFRANELGVDEEYDHDGGLELYEKRSKKGTKDQREARDRDRQVSDHQRTQNAQGACMLCMASARRPGHLLVSSGAGAYLALPAAGRLVPGHCVIAPTEHTASMRQLDEHVWEEVKNFMKCLVKMFMAQGQTPLFMETAMNVNTAHPHAVIECVPLPRAAADKAPAYFAKGIDDATGEWSQHHAKRRIEITATKTLRNAVPPNFPYFYVQFGWGAGFCHVMDNEAEFDPAFGRQVAIGLLKLPAEEMHRRIKAESVPAQKQWVADFRKQWAPHDWTEQR